MGALVAVNNDVQQENLTAAAITNDGVTPQNTSEENQKILNEIYLVTWAVGNYDFTEEQVSTLEYIAYQDPYYGGASAVYGAQAMLDIDISYGSNDDANRMLDDDQIKSSDNNYLLSPQPAIDYAEFLNFRLNEGDKCIIELYDVTGRKLSLQKFYNMEYPVRINLKGFVSGVYGYKISLNNVSVNSGMLTVK